MKNRRFLSHLIVHYICLFHKGIKTEDGGNKINHLCARNKAKPLLGKSKIVVAIRHNKEVKQLFVSYCYVIKGNCDR